MEQEGDNLDERTRDILSGDRVRPFEARVLAKRRLGDDIPPLFVGEQLPQSEIMLRLAASPTWRIKDVQDAKFESPAGTRKGFTVRMMRHPDGAVTDLHFVHVIDELYRLVRWNVADGRDRRYG